MGTPQPSCLSEHTASHQSSHLTLLAHPHTPECITTTEICTLELPREMAAMSACSQESLLFSRKSWSLMPSVIFAKQESLKPGRKGLAFTSSTRACCLRGKGRETPNLIGEESWHSCQSFSWCVSGMHGGVGCPELPAGPVQAARQAGSRGSIFRDSSYSVSSSMIRVLSSRY